MELLQQLGGGHEVPANAASSIQAMHRAAEGCAARRLQLSKGHNILMKQLVAAKQHLQDVQSNVTSIGCAWKKCPANQCPKCSAGLHQHSSR